MSIRRRPKMHREKWWACWSDEAEAIESLHMDKAAAEDAAGGWIKDGYRMSVRCARVSVVPPAKEGAPDV